MKARVVAVKRSYEDRPLSGSHNLKAAGINSGGLFSRGVPRRLRGIPAAFRGVFLTSKNAQGLAQRFAKYMADEISN